MRSPDGRRRRPGDSSGNLTFAGSADGREDVAADAPQIASLAAGKVHSAGRHKWPVWHVVRRSLGAALLLAPRPHRFRAALTCARIVSALIRSTEMYGGRASSLADGPLEIALYAILEAMTRQGVEFDIPLEIRGADTFDSASGEGRGVLLISAHSMLGLSFFRHLQSSGRRVALVATHGYLLPGTRDQLTIVSPGLKSFLEVRDRLRKGEVVGAAIDRAGVERHTHPLAAAGGHSIHVASPLVEVAVSAGAPVVFMRSFVERNGVVVELVAPSPAGRSAASTTLQEFSSFVRGHIHERLA